MINYKTFPEKETLTELEISELNLLFKQLDASSPAVTLESLTNTIKHSRLIVAKDGEKIVGSGTLCIMYTPKFLLGHIEQVVVDSNYRRQGIGRNISQKLIDEGKKLGLKNLSLTSNAKRIEANNLYKSLGFELWETNAYRMRL